MEGPNSVTSRYLNLDTCVRVVFGFNCVSKSGHQKDMMYLGRKEGRKKEIKKFQLD